MNPPIWRIALLSSSLLLISCSVNKFPEVFYDGFLGPYVTTGDGKPSSTSELDSLRGQHAGRAEEQMEFSRKLRESRLGLPTHEAWAGNPEWDGGDAIVTDLTGWTEQELKVLMAKQGGIYYTGRVKTRAWKYASRRWQFKKDSYFVCLAEAIYKDESSGTVRYVHGWQGPNPPIGFYPNGLNNEPFIEGPTPLIIDINYEENQTPDWIFNNE